jgi:hypothetical protein
MQPPSKIASDCLMPGFNLVLINALLYLEFGQAASRYLLLDSNLPITQIFVLPIFVKLVFQNLQKPRDSSILSSRRDPISKSDVKYPKNARRNIRRHCTYETEIPDSLILVKLLIGNCYRLQLILGNNNNNVIDFVNESIQYANDTTRQRHNNDTIRQLHNTITTRYNNDKILLLACQISLYHLVLVSVSVVERDFR